MSTRGQCFSILVGWCLLVAVTAGCYAPRARIICKHPAPTVDHLLRDAKRLLEAPNAVTNSGDVIVALERALREHSAPAPLKTVDVSVPLSWIQVDGPRGFLFIVPMDPGNRIAEYLHGWFERAPWSQTGQVIARRYYFGEGKLYLQYQDFGAGIYLFKWPPRSADVKEVSPNQSSQTTAAPRLDSDPSP